jgi:hypothetical protein
MLTRFLLIIVLCDTISHGGKLDDFLKITWTRTGDLLLWTSRVRVTPDGEGGDLTYPSGTTVARELGKGVRGEEEPRRDVVGVWDTLDFAILL